MAFTRKQRNNGNYEALIRNTEKDEKEDQIKEP